MNILAIDTSSSSMSVCIKQDENITAEINLNNGLVHSVQLMPCIEYLFKTIDFDKKDLDLVAVTTGPGSFTGIRIGVATANAMATALNIPVVSVKSLEAFAMNFIDFTDGLIIPTIDAQRDSVYAGFYKSDGKSLTEIEENKIMTDEEIFEYVKNSNEKIILCGFINSLIEDEISYKSNCANDFIKASNVAITAERLHLKNDDKNLAKPVYMRKSQAEIVYENKMKQKRDKDEKK